MCCPPAYRHTDHDLHQTGGKAEVMAISIVQGGTLRFPGEGESDWNAFVRQFRKQKNEPALSRTLDLYRRSHRA
jgi:hypothetical protein